MNTPVFPSEIFSSPARRNRRFERSLNWFGRILLLLGAALLWAGQAAKAVTDTPVTVVTTGTDLSQPATYSPSGVAVGGTDDVQFTNSTYNGTTFTVGGASLNYGSLDDLNASQALTIVNNSFGPTTLTLSLVNTNETTGAAATDLLYVASGGSLTIGNNATALTLALANTGTVDNAGTLAIVAPVSITAGKTITFTGNGATTISGAIANTTGAVTINDAGGSVTLSGVNAFTGATTLTGGTLILGNQLALQSSVLTDSGAGTLVFSSAVANNTFNISGLAGSSNIALTNNAGTPAAINLNLDGAGGTYSGVLSDGGLGGSLTISDNGNVTTGAETLSNTSTYTGATTVAGGSLILTGSLSSPTLNVGGGTFTYSKAATSTQAFTNTNIIGGLGNISNTVGADTLALGTLSRTVGGTVNFTTTGAINTVTANTGTTILGGWATVGGVNWATSAGNGATAGNITALGSYANDTWAAANNTTVTLASNTVTSATTNSLRYNSGTTDALTLSGVNTISTGGILYGNNVADSLSGGFLQPAAATGELIFIGSGNNTLTVTSVLQNNGTTPTNVTDSLSAGILLLGSSNTFTGSLYINNGTANSTVAGGFGNGVLVIGGSGGASTAIAEWNVAAQTVTNSSIVINPGGAVSSLSALGGRVMFFASGAFTENAPITLIGGANLSVEADNQTGTFGSTANISGTGNVFFAGDGTNNGTVNLAGSFNPVGTFNAGNSGNGALTLTVTGTIGSNVTAVNVQTGALASTPGALILTGSNTYTGPTTINFGTLQLGNGTTGKDGSINSTSGVTLANNASAILDYDIFGTQGVPYAISGGGIVEMTGPGTATLSGNISGSNAVTLNNATGNLILSGANNTFTGALSDLAGTLTLVGATVYNSNNIFLSPGTTLNLGGGTAGGSFASTGTLTLNGGNTFNYNETGTPVQTLAALNLVTSGSYTGVSTVTAASGDTLNLGAITPAVGGGAVNFSGAGTITTTNTPIGGLLGGFATVSGTNFAAVSGGGTISALTTYESTAAGGITSSNYSGANVDVTNSPGVIDGTGTLNSVRFNTAGADTLSLGGTNVITSGGILVTPNVGNNLSTISGGAISGASGSQLVINQNNTANTTGLLITSVIADNGSPTALNKLGAGNATLDAVNSYTGQTYVNSGSLTVNGSLAPASTVNVGTTGTLAGTGVIGGNVVTTNNAALNMSSGSVIEGTLNSTTASGATTNWTGKGTVDGAITLSGAGSFTVASGGVLFATGGITEGGTTNLTNSGTIIGNTVFNSTNLPANSGAYAGTSATMTLGNVGGGGTGGITTNASSSFGGGLFITGANNATLNDYNATNGTVFGIGDITFGTGGTTYLTIRGTANVATGLLIATGANGDLYNSNTGNGEFFLYGPGQTQTYNGGISGETGGRLDSVIVAGGTQILGSAIGTYSEYIGVLGGTLQIGNGSAGTLNSVDTLVAGGGTIIIYGKTTGLTTQVVANVAVDPGATNVNLVNNGTAVLLTDGALTRSVGGTINYNLPAGTQSTTNGVTTTTLNTNGILGGYITVNGTDWGTNSTNVSGGNIIGLSSSTLNSYTNDTWAPGNNTNVTTSDSPSSGSTTNSLRYATPGATTLTLAGSDTVTSGGILVTSLVGANATTINGGTLTSGTDLVIIQNNTNAGGALTINSVIADTVGLAVSGSGTVVITGNNTGLTGGIYVDGGILNSTSAALGVTGGIYFSGGTLQASSTSAIVSSRPVFMDGPGGTFDNNGTTSTLSGAITDNAVTGATYSNATAGIVTIGQLTSQGSGELVLSSASNTWNGGLLILSGTVQDNNANANTIGEGIVTLGASNSPVLDLNGNSATVAALAGAGTNGVVWNTKANFTSTLTLGLNAGYEATFSGLIQDGPIGGGTTAITINSTTGGIETFTNANTYSGATTITNGFLDLSNANAVQNSTVALNGGGLIFDQSVAGNAFTLGGLSGSVSLPLRNNATTPAAIALSVGNNNANTTYSGILSGPGSLTKIGNGTLILSGLSTYTGNTTISGGAIDLQSGLALQYSTLTSGTGLIFDSTVTTNTFTLGGLSGSSNLALQNNAGTPTGINLLVGNNNATTAYSGVLSQSGSLTKIGAGSLTLTGANTYSGSTTIISGNLQLGDGTTGHDGTIANTSGVTDNGTLTFDRFGSVSSGYAIGGSGNVVMTGQGTQTLSAVNGYTGTTTVSGGTLIVSGALTGSSSTSVTNATLEGPNGSITNAVTIGNGTGATSSATIEVGLALSTGVFSTGPLTLKSDSQYQFNLDPTTQTSDMLNVTGALTLNGGTLTAMLLQDTTLSSVQTFDIANFTTETGTFAGLPDGSTVTYGDNIYTINYGTLDPGEITLTAGAIPEPGTWAMLLCGAGMLLVARRRRA